MYKSLALLAVLPSTFAHFILNYPPALGPFKDDDEGTGPCGGYDISFSGNVTDTTVGGFSVALTSTHPQANWLYRVTTSTQEPYNWTNILPVVSESGLGAFCLPELTVSPSFVGQQAIIQVTQGAVDGNLYQCAAVKFVEGSTSSVPSACTNATGVTATLTTQTSFDNSTSTSASSSGSASTTSSGTTASSSAAGAVQKVAGGLLAVLPAALLLL
ncbi:hypothetical protein LTR70_004964 [Exophiala xenobiotica]|uniref:Copper acquisition factor BIM1-like domain-containing protein n=1 Tax=Lithohypha guttulata TaxID=1690604 RepID=A0ABR0JWR9_9EURO|nr:hypothetical protein LTR24_009650 [Lithohypha guttulata]KAK5319345.1 hypothetical protein LTR70_004964 [Exophiala xenobiotica]